MKRYQVIPSHKFCEIGHQETAPTNKNKLLNMTQTHVPGFLPLELYLHIPIYEVFSGEECLKHNFFKIMNSFEKCLL